MNLTEFSKEVHQNAVAHGWWERPRKLGEVIALCHAELSEALEEYRDSKPNVYFMKQDKMSAAFGECDMDICTDMGSWKGEKPEGIAVELGDTVIRILDYCGREDINLSKPMIFDSVAKADTFEDLISLCHSCLSYAYCESMVEGGWIIESFMWDCIVYIYRWASENDVDMDEVIRVKHEYNKTRPYKHGGKKI